MKQPLSGIEGYVSLIRNVVILVQNKPVLFWNIRLALHRLDRKLYPRRGCPVLDFSSGSSFTIRTRSSLPLSAVIITENALEYKTLVLRSESYQKYNFYLPFHWHPSSCQTTSELKSSFSRKPDWPIERWLPWVDLSNPVPTNNL